MERMHNTPSIKNSISSIFTQILGPASKYPFVTFLFFKFCVTIIIDMDFTNITHPMNELYTDIFLTRFANYDFDVTSWTGWPYWRGYLGSNH